MKLSSVNGNVPCQNRPQNFGAVKVNVEALELLKLPGESHVPGSLRYLLSIMEETEAISHVSHNAYKSLLGKNDVILNKSEIEALRISTKASNADTTIDTSIHRLAGARFFDLSTLFPNGKQSVADACRNRIAQSEITIENIQKALRAIRKSIFKEAEVASTPITRIEDGAQVAEIVPIARIEDSFQSREKTLEGIPQLAANG